jgi:2-phospho-L-lactate transferase/gluconeogenesis factor (CofD/UPF0052 family)
MVPGMVHAIKASPALKVFVVNVASQHGETDNFNVSDYLRVLADHVDDMRFDFIIVNSNLSHMPTGGQSQVIFDYQEAQLRDPRARFIAADAVNARIPSHHDSEKLAKVIIKRVWQA